MAQRFPSLVCGAVTCLVLLSAASLPSQESAKAEKKIKNRGMRWNPPQVDAPLRGVSDSPPCTIGEVLAQAGARAREQEDNLPNFTAEETIEYRAFQKSGNLTDVYSPSIPLDSLEDAAGGTYEYLVQVATHNGHISVEETRTPEKGTKPFPASAQDVGLPEMDLVFLPEFQNDYDMKCAGAAQWNGEATWVVHFQQRPDKTGHTLSFHDKKASYYAKLKGRAWIAQDTGDVAHLELMMMEPIPQMDVEQWWLSIDYAPVQFHSKNVRIWLPQTVDAYALFSDRRTILYHTFSNFMLFSVQTKEKIQTPEQPQ
jgi:hypothetical protein